jgi:glycosyltransferase involved in cell wall biosynthesis
MRVLFVIHYPVYGGPHNRIARLFAALRELRVEPAVVLPLEPGNGAQRLEAAGVPVSRIPLRRIRSARNPLVNARTLMTFLSDVARLRSIVVRGDYDVVVAGGLINPHGAVAGRRAGRPVVWQIVDTLVPDIVAAIAMQLVRRYSSVAMFGAEALVERYVQGRDMSMPIMVARPTVDTELFVPGAGVRIQGREALEIPARAKVVGMVANFNPMKGVEYFIASTPAILAKHPDAHFVIVGSSHETHRAYEASLRRAAADLGMGERIRFVGARDDLERIYPAFDLKVISSLPRSEGTTTTAIEAAACGVPVVATRVGGVAEVVSHGATGVLVPPESPTAIASAVSQLLDDAEARQRLGAEARRLAVREFGIRAGARRYLEIFEAAVEHGRR